MIAYFFLGLSLLVGFILLARWFVAVEPRKVMGVLRWVAAILGLIFGGFLLWGGREAMAALALPLLLPLLMRVAAVWRRASAARGPRPGQASRVETRYLRMTLDHDSGEMSGVVREGHFTGRGLEELGEDDLIALWRECRAEDDQSAAVLEAYLDRTRGEAWRARAGAGRAEAGGQSGPGPAPGGGRMAAEEAYEILGVAPGASDAEIREAHRRLMQKLHPDHGGSNYLAAKINEAKDLLLGA